MTTTTSRKRRNIIRDLQHPHVKAWFLEGIETTVASGVRADFLVCRGCFHSGFHDMAKAPVPLGYDELCALWVRENDHDTSAPFPARDACGKDLGAA